MAQRPPPSFPNGVRAAPMIAVLGMKFAAPSVRGSGEPYSGALPNGSSSIGIQGYVGQYVGLPSGPGVTSLALAHFGPPRRLDPEERSA